MGDADHFCLFKREGLQYEEDDRSDTEEEKPVVVVLKDGDLTEEQASEVKKDLQDKAEEGFLSFLSQTVDKIGRYCGLLSTIFFFKHVH